MFILVLQQCHKENEDKWKRLSRQIADIILPMIAKQQVGKPLQVYGVGDDLIKLLYSRVQHTSKHMFVCYFTDAPGLSRGFGSIEHSV